MAQLVKLQDYISRYEIDMFRYPSQFIRMKKDNYARLRQQWEDEQATPQIAEPEEIEEKKSFFKKWFKRKDQFDVWEDDEEEAIPLPEQESELKYFFLDRVFSFQLKWASSTLQEVSYFDRYYEHDLLLKYFLQRFPDTYLLFYNPIFKLKKAVVEADVMLITPTEIQCIVVLDQEGENITYQPVDDRKWMKVQDGVEKQIVSPLVSLKRTEKTIKSILDYNELEFPIKKVVLTQHNQIRHQQAPYQTEYVDETNYAEWFERQRETSYPIKYQQLKVSEALLEHTQKTFVKRPIWMDEDQDMT
ncbi:NERD domain-containing protein [Aquisalibacillus elongatus]|uniref:Nuclease-like protein n=1 Tax=Aquisalibacillus elongatus TaxID=485577 RepID=A0A3N5CDT3_9BACI|nr:NERD domain-containing protein [Aquisalibacillus elongatus]RPF55301.1 nuclease-like protein [Aquisalibacillus elongatus]